MIPDAMPKWLVATIVFVSVVVAVISFHFVGWWALLVAPATFCAIWVGLVFLAICAWVASGSH